MRPAFRKTILACLLLSGSVAVYSETITCLLTGTVVNRKSKNLLIVKRTEDMRINNQKIPIQNNNFRFTLTTDVQEAYMLVFEEEYNSGSYKPINFFPYSGEVRFTLYPKAEAEKNLVDGGEENKAYSAFMHTSGNWFRNEFSLLEEKREALDKDHNYRNPVRDSIIRLTQTEKDIVAKKKLWLLIDELEKTGTDLTEQGNLVRRAVDSLLDQRDALRYQYIRANPTIVSYYLIWEDIRAGKEKIKIANAIQDAYPIFAAKFPDHPYTNKIGNALSGLIKIRPGQKFIDFTAPDLSGKEYKLSELTNGKITVVDFWGSWCSPCIAASKLMMPVYDDFKSKDFNVVGIAREFRKKDDMIAALKKYKFPWLNLVELDDTRNIWNKYAISAGAGMVLLLDKDGTILAVNPTADEVRKELQLRL